MSLKIGEAVQNEDGSIEFNLRPAISEKCIELLATRPDFEDFFESEFLAEARKKYQEEQKNG